MEAFITKVEQIPSNNDLLEPIDKHWAFHITLIGYETLKEDLILRVPESSEQFKKLLEAYHHSFHIDIYINIHY